MARGRKEQGGLVMMLIPHRCKPVVNIIFQIVIEFEIDKEGYDKFNHSSKSSIDC